MFSIRDCLCLSPELSMMTMMAMVMVMRRSEQLVSSLWFDVMSSCLSHVLTTSRQKREGTLLVLLEKVQVNFRRFLGFLQL